MWDQAREELESEYNARYDYIAELKAEHEDHYVEEEMAERLVTDDMIGKTVRCYDFQPIEGREDKFIEGTVVGYQYKLDLLEVDVVLDTTGRCREKIFTPPMGRMMEDEDYNRIEVIA